MTDFDFAELGALFEDDEFGLFLVGGSVRDMLLGRDPKDLDFTTSAHPDQIKHLLSGWADDVWDIGREFGTIAARKDGVDVEITTFRTDGPGRKPEVAFTTSLEEDLKRRDFTINAMAMPVDHLGLHSHGSDLEDPFDGRAHLRAGVLDTPRDPALSFGDDPLRILRAARFVSQLPRFVVSLRVQHAMSGLAIRLQDISAERIAAEMDKLLMGAHSEEGLRLLARTGIMDLLFENMAIRFDDVMLGHDVTARWAGLLRHDAPAAIEVKLKAMKFSTERVRDVVGLVSMVQGFAGVEWTKADLRWAITQAKTPEQFARFASLLRASDTLVPRARALMIDEVGIEPFLTGDEVMSILDVKPGKRVGEALAFLWDLRLNDGPMERADVGEALTTWNSINA